MRGNNYNLKEFNKYANYAFKRIDIKSKKNK